MNKKLLIVLLLVGGFTTVFAQKVYTVSSESYAKKKIYFVSSESYADLKIFFVNSESYAGWKNDSKKHLMY